MLLRRRLDDDGDIAVRCDLSFVNRGKTIRFETSKAKKGDCCCG